MPRLPVPPPPSPRRLAAWVGELARVPTGLAEAYVPGAGIPARTREQLILAVTDVHGHRTVAWVHGAWLDFLGRRDPAEALGPLFDYARTCAEVGAPLDTTTLQAAFPPKVVRSVRATVARAELGNAVGALVEGLGSRLLGRRRPPAADVALDAAAVAVAVPLVAPTVVLAGAMKLLARLAPDLPDVDLADADEANLVSHLLAEAAPSYLGHTFVRTGLVWSPVVVAVAFRMEGSSATIRLGRGRVEIDNGVTPDALVVVDGGVEALVSTVAGSILRDLGVPLRWPR